MEILNNKAYMLNAKVSALAMAVGAFSTLLLTHTSVALSPLRIVTIATVAFAVWAFVDEMGVRKPLNRAGFVFFSVAVVCKIHLVLGVDENLQARYLLLYCSFLLLAVLFWSIAFLHRKMSLKIIGGVGLLTAIVPLLALVAGHLVVGFGVFIGVGVILSGSNAVEFLNTGYVIVVERLFSMWCYVAAWLLWKGHIRTQSTLEVPTVS